MSKQSLFKLALWAIVVCISKFLVFKYSSADFPIRFSGLVIAVPLIGALFPSSMSRWVGALAWGAIHLFHLIPVTLGIPTALATLSWSLSSKKGRGNTLFHLLFPVMAMVLFLCNDTGMSAWPYVLYWLIPMGCLLFQGSLFGRALQSTFVAHAAGSVMWLHLMPTTSSYWLSLIPVVAVERLVFSTCAFVALTVIYKASSKLNAFAPDTSYEPVPVKAAA